MITWDRLTGEPLYPAIVWSDTRTIDTVEQLSKKSDKGVDALQHICGLPITTYFSAVKLRWLLDNIPIVSQAQKQNRLCVGTVDAWLIYVSLVPYCVTFLFKSLHCSHTKNFFIFYIEPYRRLRTSWCLRNRCNKCKQNYAYGYSYLDMEPRSLRVRTDIISTSNYILNFFFFQF